MLVFRFLQGIGTGGEVPVASRLHQRVHRRQEARPVLPALRGHLPDRTAVRRPRRLLPRPALRLARAVHRRPRPGRADDPPAGPHARVPPLARLQGPHRRRPTRSSPCSNAKRSRKASRCPSRSSARSTPKPPRAPTGARLFRGLYLKRTLMIWALWISVYVDQQRPGHLAAHALPPGLQAPAADQPALRLDHLRRRRGRLPHLRALHRQGRPQTLVHHRVPARHRARSSSSPPWAPPPPPRSSSSPRSPTRSCRPSRSRSTSTPPSSTPPACAPWAPASAARGCGPAPPSARSWSGSSSPASASATCSSPSPSIALIGGLITARFAIETKGKVLEELSP